MQSQRANAHPPDLAVFSLEVFDRADVACDKKRRWQWTEGGLVNEEWEREVWMLSKMRRGGREKQPERIGDPRGNLKTYRKGWRECSLHIYEDQSPDPGNRLTNRTSHKDILKNKTLSAQEKMMKSQGSWGSWNDSTEMEKKNWDEREGVRSWESGIEWAVCTDGWIPVM